MQKKLAIIRSLFPQVTGLVVIALISAFAIGMLINDGSLWGIAVPFSTLSVSCVLLLFLLREITSQRYFRRQGKKLRRKVRQLEETNRWLELTEAHAHVGHWRLDLRNDTVFWSDETFRIHGVEPGNTPDLSSAINVYHPEDRQIVIDAIETARETGEPFRFRARILRQDGDVRHVESIALLKYEDGLPVTLFGVFADRTEEESLQADLRDARDDARAMAEAKSTFLARMSHEIRTPMNGVLGFVDLLLESDLTASQRRHAELISESGRNLQDLLSDILDMSKIESGRLRIHTKPTDLRDVLQSTVELAQPIAREKKVQLLCEIEDDLRERIQLDPLRLRQIVGNLVANAIRFTDKGRVTLTAKNEDNKLVLQVCDTGIGIDPKLFDHIFDAFSSINHAEVHGRGGTGLGLAICRQLAELMGGAITVESEPGVGSRFTVILPLISAGLNLVHSAGEKQTSSAHSLPSENAPVLLAEDFDINRELVVEMAKKIGLKVDAAVDGAEAVAMVKRAAQDGSPYRLVLMDLQMPVMDGLSAARKLREDGFSADSLPILALTANAYAEDVAASKAAGMQAHLSKPLSMDAFREAMERWLPSGSDRAA